MMLIDLRGKGSVVEWKWNLVTHGDAREENWRGKRRMEWVAKQSSVSLGRVHPVLLQSFFPDPHSKKASTRLNWHPCRYKWTRPLRWKTESGFCMCVPSHSVFTLQHYKGAVGSLKSIACHQTEPYIVSISFDRHLLVRNHNRRAVLQKVKTCMYWVRSGM